METPAATTRSRLGSLLVGESRVQTRRALALAASFVVGLAAIEYAVLLGPDSELMDALWRAFVLEADLATAADHGSGGAVLVAGLAGIHAYLNEGYLPSVVLASAPIFGAGLWTIGSPTRVAGLYLDPVSAVRRTLPEAILFATVGFLLGIALRWLNRRLHARREQAAPN